MQTAGFLLLGAAPALTLGWATESTAAGPRVRRSVATHVGATLRLSLQEGALGTDTPRVRRGSSA